MKTLLIILIIIGILFLIYLYLIMPRMAGRPDTSVFDEGLFAHRGLYDNTSDAPENTMKAFRLAVEKGFGIEMDVQLSKDRVPVIMHDYDLNRACGMDRRVEDCLFEELAAMKLFGSDEGVPAFADVLKAIDGKVPLIIEYKADTADISVCDAAWEVLKDYRGRYCVESFNPLVLKWFRKNHPEIMRGQLSDGFIHMKEFSRFPKVLFYGALEALLDHVVSRPDFVAYNWRYEANPSRRIVRGLFGLPAAAWTIQSPRELEEMKKHFDVFIFDSFVPEKEPGKERA